MAHHLAVGRVHVHVVAEDRRADQQRNAPNPTVDLVTVKTPGRININTASPTVLRALGLADAEISEILQGRRDGPYTDAGRFAGRDLAATTQTFRVQAEGLIGEEPRARLTAVVRKRTEGTGDVLVVLEWSETR